MKTQLLTAVIATLFALAGHSQTLFWSDAFEDSGSPSSGTRVPEVNTGSGDNYFLRTDGVTGISVNPPKYSGMEGTKFWAGEGHSGVLEAELQIEFQGINASGLTNLEFRGLFAANNGAAWENQLVGASSTDYMTVEYSFNSGGSWTTLLDFRGNDNTNKQLCLDTNGDGIGDGTPLTYTFSERTKTITATGTTMILRIRVSANGIGEEWAIDNFRLYHTPACTAPVFSAHPQTSHNMCAGTGTTTFGPVAASNTTAYKWQYNSGSGFTDLTNDTYHSGVTTNTLTITSPLASMNGWLYRAVAINGGATCTTNSNSGTLNVSNISANPSQTNVDCNGNSTGAAGVSPAGGIGSYTYLWSVGGTSAIRAGLTAGTYNVTITDAAGCQKVQNFTITQPPVLNGTTVVTNVACFGGNTGAINLTPSGGSPGYTFNWASGPTTEDRTNLVAGTYSVTITDANNCTKVVNATITQPPSAISGTTVVTNVACFGGNSGAINLTPTGGTGPYTFNWASGPTTEDRTNLTAGTYSVTITDANGCTGTVNATVTQPAAVSGTSVVTNIACFGGNTGAINLTPTGGTGPYTFNWGGGVTSEDRTNLTAGTYSVTITDANACTGTVNMTVTQPTAAVSGTTVVTNVACFGGNTGAINLTPTGGVGPYTFNWASGPTTEDRTNLTAGTYSVTITDANGCTGTVNATLTQPSAIVSGTTVVTNVACFGGNTGAINLTPTGGVGPYTFNWASGPTTEDRTNLTAGTYSVTITDANGCTGTVNATVTQPATAVSGTTVVTNIACFGGNTGAINLTPTGGVGPYTFNWGGGVTSEDRTNLTAGTYSVTITDANGCTGTVSPTVTQPAAAVSGTTVVTNVACFGGNTGAINLTPTGGVGPYTFNWGGGITSEDRTNLTAGTYSVTITDANGCTGTVSPTVTQPAAAVSGTTVVTNVACFGGNTGAINLTPTGGVGPYTFNWVGGVTSEDRTNLTAGSYSVTITDANGCTGTISPITLTQPAAAVSGTTVVTNVACFGNNTGAINLTPTGGVGPYTFNWVGGVTTEDRTSLTAGSYSVTITDANGCTGTVSPIVVTQPASAVSGTTVVTNIACFGNNTGSINLTPTGGVAPYTFNWGGGITSEDRTNLTAGTYSVTITDANGCTGTVSPTVTQPASALSGTTVVTNIACFGGNTGAINLTPTGGTGPYTFNWGGGVTSEDRTGLTAGSYSVTITDANGCTATINATLTQPAAVVSGTTVVTNVSCFGGNTGAINLTPTGGVGPYTFNWVGGATTEDRVLLVAGSYSVTITDANGCTGTVNATITQPTALVASAAAQTNITCNSGMNGSATVLASGGNPGYTYSWSPSGGTAATASGLTAGTYTVTVTDANGCTTSQSFTITEPAAISFTAAAQTNVACFGGSTGALVVNPATGGTGAFTYDWNPGTPTGDGTTSITGLAAGSYSVTATDANGCSATISFVITQPPVLAITGASQTEVSCNGGSNGTATVTVTGGQPGYTYSWSPSGGTAATATGLQAGSYTATVTDANGCTAIQTFVLNEPTAIDLSVSSQSDVICNGGATGSASVTPSGGTGSYTYSWSPSGGTAATATGLEAGTYTVTVTDDNNCQDTKTFTITEPAVVTSSFSHDACNSYTWGTQTHTSSGVYTQTFTTVNGCDSIVTLTLSIVSEITNTVTESSCISYTWAQNGMTYTASGLYVDTIPAAGGCDSIVTLDLTINTPSSSSSSEFACGTYTWAQNGVTYTASGVYTDTIPNAAGCDSIVTLNLTIGGFSSLQPASACESYTWAANGVTYTATGMYFDTLVDINGCDSILILDLIINPSVTATAADNGNGTITASAGTTYQWINCSTNMPVAGATAQTFAPSVNGNYSVVITNASNCSDTSDCVEIDYLGLSDLDLSSVEVFPNPTESKVTISMSVNSAKLTITDAQGKTQFTGPINNGQQVDLGSYEDGVYFLSIETESGKVLKRIVKN
ncbi:T9SS type A sorting domain-containing protein [Fluviicola sp.]|uniref:T9SS type A sorting domain-containing protein n=1 Tax=Fluviicola sp. TaxID=1917219 RepID=UPI0031DFB38F